MRKLSRGALAAIAAAVAIPAGVAIAHNFEHGGWQRLSPEARARLDEGRLAMAKTALKLNPEQEKLWAPVESEVRAGFKARAGHMAEREKMRDERRKEREVDKDGKDASDGAAKTGNIADRIEKMSQRMGERADRMKAFAGAFKPFYASLSDEQKEVLRPLMREMMGGPGGKGQHGKRWAMGGGWGEGGERGWGRHGGGGHHGHRGPDGPDGPGFRDDRGGGGPGADDDGERGPPAEQLMPDADDASPVAPDKL